MNKSKRLIMLCCICCWLMISFCFAANPKVQINGEIIDFTDSAGNKVEAQIINNRTMVPLRKIFEVLNCTVDWDEPTKTVTAKKISQTLILQIGNKEAKLIDNDTNKEQVFTLDSEPVIVSNRTLVPFRFIGESLGMTVAWDAQSETAIIIDFDSLAQILKSKSPNFYEDLFGSTITVEKRYFDEADSSRNGTTKIEISESSVNDGKQLQINIDGTSEFSREVKTEEWDNIKYTLFNNGEINTANYAFSSMLGIDKNANTPMNYEKYGLSKDNASSLKDWIKGVTNINEKAIKQETYDVLKRDWTKFANTFLSNGDRKISAEDFNYTYINFDKILSKRAGNEQACLLLLNKVLFRYETNFQDILSDYPVITYSFTEQDKTGSKIKISMKNEYKERVEYEVNFKN